jgi:hypothetical protein
VVPCQGSGTGGVSIPPFVPTLPGLLARLSGFPTRRGLALKLAVRSAAQWGWSIDRLAARVVEDDTDASHRHRRMTGAGVANYACNLHGFIERPVHP